MGKQLRNSSFENISKRFLLPMSDRIDLKDRRTVDESVLDVSIFSHQFSLGNQMFQQKLRDICSGHTSMPVVSFNYSFPLPDSRVVDLFSWPNEKYSSGI